MTNKIFGATPEEIAEAEKEYGHIIDDPSVKGFVDYMFFYADGLQTGLEDLKHKQLLNTEANNFKENPSRENYTRYLKTLFFGDPQFKLTEIECGVDIED